MINPRSREAYYSILESLNKKQTLVLGAMKMLREATNENLAEYLRWPIHTVTPRTGELIKKNLIKRNGEAKTKSGRKADVFVLANPETVSENQIPIWLGI